MSAGTAVFKAHVHKYVLNDLQFIDPWHTPSELCPCRTWLAQVLVKHIESMGLIDNARKSDKYR